MAIVLDSGLRYLVIVVILSFQPVEGFYLTLWARLNKIYTGPIAYKNKGPCGPEAKTALLT